MCREGRFTTLREIKVWGSGNNPLQQTRQLYSAIRVKYGVSTTSGCLAEDREHAEDCWSVWWDATGRSLHKSALYGRRGRLFQIIPSTPVQQRGVNPARAPADEPQHALDAGSQNISMQEVPWRTVLSGRVCTENFTRNYRHYPMGVEIAIPSQRGAQCLHEQLQLALVLLYQRNKV